MLGELAGPEPIFDAPDPPTVTCGTGGAVLDATARGAAGGRLRDSRFCNGCGFTEAAGPCTVIGGNACGFAVSLSTGDWARA